MTGRQNVKFIARVHGGERAVNSTIKFVEDFAEIGPAFDEPVMTYSSGMKSRLSFGVSLAFDFDVYLSDEATAVGDALFKKKATDLFKSRVGKASLIMVSHSEGILRELCQAGVWLHDGKAFWFDQISEALDAYRIYRETGKVLNQYALREMLENGMKLQGRLGGITKNGQTVFGWARNSLVPKKPLTIQIYLNGDLLIEVDANKPRKDLDAKYPFPCAFSWTLPNSQKLQQGDLVRAIVKQTGEDLPNSPAQFS